MVPKLYGDLRSPCVRATVFAAEILNVNIKYIPVDIFKKEQYKPEFLEINPTHTVPTLNDNGFVIWDSHAIMTYLAEKYGKNHSLYPVDIQKRTIINQMLNFEAGKLFAMHRYIGASLIRGKFTRIPEDLKEEVKAAYEFLNTFLENSNYLTGNDLTLADLSVWTTLTNSQIYLPIDESEYPNLNKFLIRMDELPYAELNRNEKNKVQVLVESILEK